MITKDKEHEPRIEIHTESSDNLLVRFYAALTVDTAASILNQMRTAIPEVSYLSVTVDLGNVSHFDDYGALIVNKLKNLTKSEDGSFQIINADATSKHFLETFHFDTIEPPSSLASRNEPGTFIRAGELTFHLLHNIRYMISFLGSVILSLVQAMGHPRSFRANDTIAIMEKTGVNALPIVGLISFLLGLVIAFMSSLQLQQFGANLYVASLVAIAMVSELGPIMTAIVVAGRTGSAFAAEIGTMKISEEIDALFLMGFAPTLFLAVPRIVAAVIVVPLLTLFADVFGILGGLFVGVTLLDLTVNTYITQTLKTLTLFEILWGLSKSVVFALLIAWIGCLRGFQTRGGADAVGNAATSAVVTSIFLIILFDSIFAITRSYL